MKKGNEQFRFLFEQATDGIFIADQQGNYTDVNPAGCKMLGYTKDEITKLSISDVITEDEAERLAPDVELLLQNETIKNHWKFRRKDHTVFVGEVTATRLSDGRIQAILRNVTEQMLEREVLSRNEVYAALTLEHMLEGCQIMGFDWRYLYLNRTAEIHNRRPNEELLGNRFMDMWPGIEETEVYKIIKQTLEQRVSYQMVYKHVFSDGKHSWFNLSIQPVPEGVFILSIDITERKKAEEEMFASKTTLEIALASMTDAVVITDAEGNFIEFNEAFATFHKFKNKDECSKTFAAYP